MTAVKYLRKAAKGAPGRDGIQGWVYGLLDEGELRATIKVVLQMITHSGLPPAGWGELRVIPIFKDGDGLDVARYRPITLIVVLAKAVEAVIKSIAEEGQDGGGKKLHPSVMGFVKGKGGHLAIFNLVETVLFNHDQTV